MKLELYYQPTCLFCRKVLSFMDENEISGVELKDKTAHPEYEQELINVGGKAQVPCLVRDGDPLYESDKIMEWLGENRENSK
ncbi:MAG: glutaredoxin family protein [Candidatus Omnitrophota bacterium]